MISEFIYSPNISALKARVIDWEMFKSVSAEFTVRYSLFDVHL